MNPEDFKNPEEEIMHFMAGLGTSTIIDKCSKIALDVYKAQLIEKRDFKQDSTRLEAEKNFKDLLSKMKYGGELEKLGASSENINLCAFNSLMYIYDSIVSVHTCLIGEFNAAVGNRDDEHKGINLDDIDLNDLLN